MFIANLKGILIIDLAKRPMKILQKTLYQLLFLAFTLNLSAQQNPTSPVTLNKIADKLYEIKGGAGANGGLFSGDEGVIVIDAKMTKESVDQTIAVIRKLTDKPIKFLVNTHSDGDHVAGNRYFPESVVIVAQENCRQEFFHPGRNGDPSAWNDPQLALYIPSVTFKTKMDLYVDPKKVELWYFGVGHTTGDAVVYFPDYKVAFIGDQVFVGRPQLIHSYKGGNSFQHVETLEKMLATLDAQKFYSGHSDVLNREQIQAHINEMKAMQNKVGELMKKNISLENIKKEFSSDQAAVVETIYNEIKTGN
jgi:cyclase